MKIWMNGVYQRIRYIKPLNSSVFVNKPIKNLSHLKWFDQEDCVKYNVKQSDCATLILLGEKELNRWQQNRIELQKRQNYGINHHSPEINT